MAEILNKVPRLAAAGLAAAAMGGDVLADTAQAVEPIPDKVEYIVRHNAVRLTELRCSGWLLRDLKGEIEGVVTAEHCGLSDGRKERYQGSDGQTYFIQPKEIKAQLGNKFGRMRTVAAINRFILPGTVDHVDYSHDMALGVAEGHTPQEVIKDFQRQKLPADKLKRGDTLFAGAYPIKQPGYFPNQPKPDKQHPTISEVGRRQIMKISVTNNQAVHGVSLDGSSNYADSNYKKVRMVDGIMTATRDGAECSPGASGSVAFKLVKGKPRIIGSLSNYYDSTGGLGVYDPENYGDNAVATCSYATELDLPRGNDFWPNYNGSIVNPVSTTGEIPGYMTYEQMIAKAGVQVDDPNITKFVLKGRLMLPLKGGGRREASTNTHPHADDPMLIHFNTPRTTLIAYAMPYTKGSGTTTPSNNMSVAVMQDRSLSKLKLYAEAGSKESPTFYGTKGQIEYYPSNKGAYFIDESQNIFGQLDYEDIDPEEDTYMVNFADGQYHIFNTIPNAVARK